MPTRSSRKRAIAEPIVLNPKKHRVVLGDLPNLQNASISETQSSGNLQQHMFTRLIILIWINRFRESTTQNMKSNRLLNRMEMEKKLRLMVGYIENGQRFITTNTRGILVDWIPYSNLRCLPMKRWDKLNHFFNNTGAVVTFGLNALSGRHKISHTVWGGNWDPTNAYDFINYTISKGYKIDSWEFGNELSGKGIAASVGAAQYGRDLIKLKQNLKTLYKNTKLKQPSLIAPGGFYQKEWFDQLLQVSGSGVVDVMTHHVYNLGPGSDPHLENKILDPARLSKVESLFSNLSETWSLVGCLGWRSRGSIQ